MMRVFAFGVVLLLAFLGTSLPSAAAAKGEKKAKVSMAERKEQARQAAEERRAQAKQREEERSRKEHSKAEKAEAELAAQQAEAKARHAAELEAAAAEEKRQRAERERNSRLAEQEHSAAVRARLENRKQVLERFDVRAGEEWETHTEGLLGFRQLEDAQKYVKLAAEDKKEAQLFAEDLEDDEEALAFAQKVHLIVKATNADSLLPTIGDLRELPEGDEIAAAFDTRVKASVYLKNAAEERGIIRVLFRRKVTYWVLYRDLLALADPPERAEEPEEEEEAAEEEEERDRYEYGDDVV